MVEGHVEHLRDREPLLVGPREQVREVLGPRAHQLGAEEPAGGRIGVDVQSAAVLAHHAAAPLVPEVPSANREGPRGQLGVPRADDENTTDSGQRRRPGTTAGQRPALVPAMRPSSAASCNRGRSAAASPAMKLGASQHCSVPGSCKGTPRRSRARPAWSSLSVSMLGTRPTAESAQSKVSSWAPAPSDQATRTLDGTRSTARKRTSSCSGSSAANAAWAPWPDETANAEDAHAHAEAVQRLAQLQPDDPRPEHGDGGGQVLPREDVVVDDGARTSAACSTPAAASSTARTGPPPRPSSRRQPCGRAW